MLSLFMHQLHQTGPNLPSIPYQIHQCTHSEPRQDTTKRNATYRSKEKKAEKSRYGLHEFFRGFFEIRLLLPNAKSRREKWSRE
jgi:hypothetical protein